MKHYEFEISQFMDNELPADEQKNLFAHLSDCGECARVLSDFMNIKMGIKSVYDDMNVELKNSFAVIKAQEPVTKKRNVYKTMFYYTAAASVLFGFFLFFLEGNQSALEKKYLILLQERFNLQNKYTIVLNEKQQLTEMNKNYFDKTNLQTVKYKAPKNSYRIITTEKGSYKTVASINKKRLPPGFAQVSYTKITKDDFLIPQMIGN
ncbi:MAG: zf-HC2 domain-containing protein [Ignavibacteriaceae bacterium]|jgi:hypothetical protein